MKPILNYKTPYLYLTGLTLLVCGLPVSLFLTSLSQFFLAGSFFLEGNVNEKFKRFYSNKVAVFIAGIWLMHLIGMFWTTDLAEGIKDLRIKLPLLILPIIIAGTQPLSEKQFKGILGAFILAVFVGTISATFVLTGIIHREIHDIRDIFIYHISHIRFALFTCVAISSLVYYVFYTSASKGIYKFLLMLLLFWFLSFLVIAESLTGLIALLVVLIIFFVYHFLNLQSKIYKLIFFLLLIGVPTFIFIYVSSLIKDYNKRIELSVDLEAKTLNGNNYVHDLERKEVENGFLVNAYISDVELRKAWNERSNYKYDSLDRRNQSISSTLIRFLTSKGLRKDSVGVYSLSKNEINSVENGIANVNFQDGFYLADRIKQIIWEIDQLHHGGNPSGHSVAQRYEFWRAAIGIISAHPFFGVGTGDLIFAFQKQYEMMDTKLDVNHRLHSHNQYLSIAVAFGLIGLIYFVVVLLFPLKFRAELNELFFFYLIICLVSMLSEDTLETQPGATFVGFFFIFFFVHCKTRMIGSNK